MTQTYPAKHLFTLAGLVAARERKSYITGLVAATAVVTEALKSLVSQHPPCEDYC